MSSPVKDNTKEPDSTPVSELNLDHQEVPSTLTVTAADTTPGKKPPGSPQTTAADPVSTASDDDDLEVHPALPSTTTALDSVPDTTPRGASVQAPVATSFATAPVPTFAATAPASVPAHTPSPTPAPVASEREAKLAILTEAFPTVEKEVCEFVLESHRGNVEASINALLEISDPEFQPETQPQPQQPTPILAPIPAAPTNVVDAPPALPQRQTPSQQEQNDLARGVQGMNLQSQHHSELDPVFLASTSTSEQQLRADEDFARTLAAMDEYSARERRDVRNQEQQQNQQQQEGPSFAAEMKELIDEELPKIKERFNVAADTTKKKVNEWYTQFKTSRAEAAAQRNANQGQSSNNSRTQFDDDEEWTRYNNQDTNRRGTRLDEDEPLARNRVTPPLSGGGTTPPLPVRPYDINGGTTSPPTAVPAETTTNPRRTTLEDELDIAMNSNSPSRI